MKTRTPDRRAGLALGAALTLLIGSWLTGCGGPPEPAAVPEPTNPLLINPAARDFSENLPLLERIRSTPHGYFRFVNIEFSQEVCRRFGEALEDSPALNLHGDAHIEQYAVTDLGRGLTDFDDSSTGPAAVDLLRYGVSLVLTSEANGWEEHEVAVFDEFLRGYREALEDPTLEATEPAVALRMRAEFSYDREAYFKWVDTLMEPVPEDEGGALLESMAPYVDAMLAENPDLGGEYFEVNQIGQLRMGIGSALDLKYLVRIRGESEDPLDDVVLEIKQVRDLTGIDCIQVAQGEDPFRILVGQSRIAYEPYRFLGYVRFRDNSFWVHAWVDNYEEVDLDETFESPAELSEVAFDIGVQLGRGHPNQIAYPLDIQIRREQLRLLDLHEQELKETCAELADVAVEAWELFNASLESE